MRSKLTLVIAIILGVGAISIAFQSFQDHSSSRKNTESQQTSPFLSHSKQITFVGPRAGEGYFNKDGSEMIFQSERNPGNPFYQIYKMNLKTGETNMVSTGRGLTTCAWIHPSGKKVLFASTHLDPEFDSKVRAEIETRKNPSQKYSWSFDDQYDIFEKDLASNKLLNLTKTKGYDAEGDYSPDGKWIVFASNRSGYEANLSEEDKKAFEKDQSYMMEIYLMKADGSQVRRLTNMPGYDGGPFFSADGKKIVWRHFSADGRIAEIYTMKINEKGDGYDQKPITKLGAMSWAPYFHPSGKYVVFTTNLQGYQNFELYIVDSEGLHEPVRVTYEDGFDGLPVFHPNGKQLSWTKRNNKGDSQIYMADWDHEAALKALNLAPHDLNISKLNSEIRAQDAKSIVEFLASRDFKGRVSGSPEEIIYTEKMADLFKTWGLKQRIHKFQFLSNVKLGKENSLDFNGEKVELGKDWNPVSFSKSDKIDPKEIVFAGYGMVAPASDKFPEYNSFKGLDVKDKWVLVFRDIPQDIAGEFRFHLNIYSRVQHKVTVARNLGAKGLLVMSGPRSSYKQKLPAFRFEGGLSDSSLMVINISDEFGSKILKGSSKNNLESLQKSYDDGSNPEGFSIPSVKLGAQVSIDPIYTEGRNVIAELNVSGAKGSVVIGAHGDHLGFGLEGSSLATAQHLDRIHYGADDNASGVSGVLELAHYFSKNRKELKHNLLFAIWSAEELGNLGSKNYLKEVLSGIGKEKEDSAYLAYLNLDMIGRLKNTLYLQGVGSSLEWKEIIERVGLNSKLSLVTQDDPYLPTDASSFYIDAKIPVLSLFTGSHADYHSPSDTADKINYDGIVQIVDLLKNLVIQVDSPKTKLAYNKVEGDRSKNMAGRGFKIYLGTIPDYTQDGIKGVKISGTSKKSPAELAGLQADDIIVEFGGQKIENLYDFTYALQAVKPEVETSIKVIRSGNGLNLKIVPKMKD